MGLDPLEAVLRLKEEGVGCTIVPPRVRMVTHVGISDEDIETALTAWRAGRDGRARGGAPVKLFGPRYPEEVAKRIPPGQRLVKTWPVLHYGPIPTSDGSDWDLEVSGLVEEPFTLTYDELKALGPAGRAGGHALRDGLVHAGQRVDGRPVPRARRAGASPRPTRSGSSRTASTATRRTCRSRR